MLRPVDEHLLVELPLGGEVLVEPLHPDLGLRRDLLHGGFVEGLPAEHKGRGFEQQVFSLLLFKVLPIQDHGASESIFRI